MTGGGTMQEHITCLLTRGHGVETHGITLEPRVSDLGIEDISALYHARHACKKKQAKPIRRSSTRQTP